MISGPAGTDWTAGTCTGGIWYWWYVVLVVWRSAGSCIVGVPWSHAYSTKLTGQVVSIMIDLVPRSTSLTAFSAWLADLLSSGEEYLMVTPMRAHIA